MSNSVLDVQIAGNHYKDFTIQPIEFCQRNNLNWCESNIIKYVCRHKNKNGLQDLEKAKHYLEVLIELEYKRNLIPLEDNKIDLSNSENVNYNEMLEVEKFIMSSSTYHDNFYSKLQVIDNSNYRHNLIDIKLTDGRIKTLKLI